MGWKRQKVGRQANFFYERIIRVNKDDFPFLAVRQANAVEHICIDDIP